MAVCVNTTDMRRAIDKAVNARPQIEFSHIEDLCVVYKVTGSKGDTYTTKLWIWRGGLWGECNCPAHTGNDTKDTEYIPKPCYHLASAFLEALATNSIVLIADLTTISPQIKLIKTSPGNTPKNATRLNKTVSSGIDTALLPSTRMYQDLAKSF